MRNPAPRITLAVILDHIKGLASVVHSLERRIESRMSGLEQKVEKLEHTMNTGFKAITRRLDLIEFEDLPRRVSRLEDKVFAGADT